MNQVNSKNSKFDEILKTATRLPESAPSESIRNLLEQMRSILDGWDWVGIYLLRANGLELGPFAGKPTDHKFIEVGVGVCGSAVAENRNIVVADVRERENYLACTLETRSEIVVLIKDGEEILGQFDIDSDRVGNFTEEDSRFLENLSVIVAPHIKKLLEVTD